MLRKPFQMEYRQKKQKQQQISNPPVIVSNGLTLSDKFKALIKTKEMPNNDAYDVHLLTMDGKEENLEEVSGAQDNIQAAVDDVMKSEELTRKPNTGSKPGLPANKQVLIRATDEDHEKWKIAASGRGVSLAEFVRDACNKAAEDSICAHLMQDRKIYPWMQKCLKCGKRFQTPS